MTSFKKAAPAGGAAAGTSARVPARAANPWTAACVAFAVGLAVVLAVFWPSWRLLVDAWSSSETYSHGFVIAPVSAWLVWRMRGTLAALRPQASLLGAPVLAAAIVLWALGELSEVNVARYVAVVTMVPGLALLCFGLRPSRAMAFPLAFLYFMVPVGEGLVPWLMDGTADATVAALRATGIPVYREGLHFTLPTGRWSVVEACSGLRYVIAALVLSTLFAYLNFDGARKRVLFVAIALLLSVVANWARAYLIVMIGHLTDMRYGTGDDHVVYGWIFFGLVMMGIFWAGLRFADPAPAAPASSQSASERDANSAYGAPRAATGIAALLLASAAALAGVEAARDIQARGDAAAAIAEGLKPFSPGMMDIQPTFEGASAVVQGRLDGRGTPMQAYVAYFARQHDTGEMVRWGNQVIATGDKRWPTYERRSVSVPVEGGSLDVVERLVRSGPDERLLWSWYTIAGRSTASDREAKLLTLRAMLEGRGDHSTVNVLLAPIGGDREAAAKALAAQAARLDAAARKLTSGGRE